MTSTRGARAAGLSSILLITMLITGCAQTRASGPGAAGPGPTTSSAGDHDLVLRVAYADGFVTQEWLATRLPIVSIYGDGKVITNGPVAEIYPAPALPNLQVQQISPRDVQRLTVRALAAGVGRTLDVGSPPIADAPSTVFSVVTGGATKVTSVYALGDDYGAGGNSGLTATQVANRKTMQDLLDALTDLPRTLGAGAVGPSQPYAPTMLAAVARPWLDPQDAGLSPPPELAWPGPTLPGARLGGMADVNCVSASGEQAARVLTAASRANANTPWVSAGRRWTVVFRPLLPEESGCKSLIPTS